MEISYQEDNEEVLQDFDEESSLEDDRIGGEKTDGRNRGGDVSLESSVNSIDFDAPLLNNPGSSLMSGGREGGEHGPKAGEMMDGKQTKAEKCVGRGGWYTPN
jgi:hypothetical protein